MTPRGRPARAGGGDALLDGVPAGIAGALVFLAVFLAVDLAGGRALLTPVLVGSVVLERLAAADGGASGGRELSAGIATILLVSMAVGVVLTWLLSRPRRVPSAAATLLLAFAVQQVAFHALDAGARAELFPRLRPWTVVLAHVLAAIAMTLVLKARWPSLIEGRRDLRDDEP